MDPSMLLPPAPLRHEYDFGLTAGGRLVREARAVTRTTTEMWRLPKAVIDDAVLVASELATNAQRACPRECLRLLLRVDDPRRAGTLRVGLWDPSPALPKAVRSDPWSETGRGLLIVASLADAHGVLLTDEGGKLVWADLKMPPARRTAPITAEVGGSDRPPER